MIEQGSSKQRPLDTKAVDSSPGTDQGDTPKKGRKNEGKKKAIPEMKLTVDIQQWLRKANGKAVKMKLTDLKIDKGKAPGRIRSINYDNVARKMPGYQVLPQPGPFCATAWKESGMTRSPFLTKRGNIPSPLIYAQFTFRTGNMGHRHA